MSLIMDPAAKNKIYRDVWILLQRLGAPDDFIQDFEKDGRDRVAELDCNVLQLLRKFYGSRVVTAESQTEPAWSSQFGLDGDRMVEDPHTMAESAVAAAAIVPDTSVDAAIQVVAPVLNSAHSSLPLEKRLDADSERRVVENVQQQQGAPAIDPVPAAPMTSHSPEPRSVIDEAFDSWRENTIRKRKLHDDSGSEDEDTETEGTAFAVGLSTADMKDSSGDDALTNAADDPSDNSNGSFRKKYYKRTRISITTGKRYRHRGKNPPSDQTACKRKMIKKSKSGKPLKVPKSTYYKPPKKSQPRTSGMWPGKRTDSGEIKIVSANCWMDRVKREDSMESGFIGPKCGHKSKSIKFDLNNFVLSTPAGSELLFSPKKRRHLTYAYPKWLTGFYPGPSPFFPQIGDVVYYFRERYEAFIKEMRRVAHRNGTKCNLEFSDPNLGDMELFKVMDIQFITEPPDYAPYAMLDLERLSCDEDNCATGQRFFMRYQDMKDVADIFVMQDVVRRRKTEFQAGQRVRAIFEERGALRWSNGTVMKVDDDEKKMMSMGRLDSIHVLLDSRREKDPQWDPLSPWDLQLIPKEEKDIERNSTEYEEGRVVTRSELRSLAYAPRPDDWGGRPPYEVEKTIRKKLKKVLYRNEVERFRRPVDLAKYPQYYKEIAYPMDLTTVIRRLKYRFYRRKAALLFDIRQLVANCRAHCGYSKEDVENAKLLAAVCEDIVENPEKTATVDEIWEAKRN
ncbi:uncharacterized protein LOC129589032 isoform X2 [Paramacrobiotus metropolitanus]|uniref:uncharacterized protein LOC129589032 isoform X2 n=1 Tax=Paramacrobiotus metropolitanus TaxID=2943436 RepID=UPI00244622B4|nr:uncharacterized protein LOC129589032 isoform X2 [Paramacrobiotus metropolitanus]